MKSVYLSILFAGLVLTSTAQWKEATLNYSKPAQLANGPVHGHPNVMSYSDRGDALWLDSFEDPATWDIDNGNDAGWGIGPDVFGWGYYGDDGIESTSGGNWAFVWNGDPDDGVEEATHTLTTADPIDISDLETAALEFEYYGARFVSELFEIRVSNDGISWFVVDDLEDIELTSQQNGNNVTDNPTLRSINITPYIEAQDELWIQFDFTLNTVGANTGVAYGWFIDDVALRTVPENNLSIFSTSISDETNTGVSEYSVYTPQNQAELTFRADVQNLGGVMQTGVTMTVFVNGEEVGTSNAADLDPLTTDSLIFGPYSVPTDLGMYEVSYQLNMENEDFDPSDNSALRSFEVNEWQMGADNGEINYILPGEDYQDGEWRGGPTYEIFQEGTVYAIDVALANWDGFFEGGNATAYIMDPAADAIDDEDVFERSEETEIFNYMVNDEDAEPDELVWTPMILENPFAVFPGDVIHATIGSFNTDIRVFGSTVPFEFATFGYGDFGSGINWYNFGDIAWMVRLNYNPDVEFFPNNIEDFSAYDGFTVSQNFPNPVEDLTRVRLELDNASTVSTEIFDVAGKLIQRTDRGTLSSGSHVLHWNLGDFEAGIYRYTVVVDGKRVSKSMMVK